MTSIILVAAVVIAGFVLAYFTALRDKYMILWKHTGNPNCGRKEHFFSGLLQGLQLVSWAFMFLFVDFDAVQDITWHEIRSFILLSLDAIVVFWILFNLILNIMRNNHPNPIVWCHLGTSAIDNILILVAMGIGDTLFKKWVTKDLIAYHKIAFLLQVVIFVILITVTFIFL